MTLSDTIRLIEVTAAGQPPVKSIIRSDIFRLNSLPDAKYASFGWTQGNHTTNAESSFYTFRFTFFYIDRLTENKSNELEIQSVGISVLDNILRILDDHGAVPVGDWQYTTFNQRFVDECAGVFVTVGIEVPVNGLCADLFTDFNNDFNDDFAINGVQVY